MEHTGRPTSAEFGNYSNGLPIPQRGDSVAVLQRKLTALAEAVCRGQSVALVTNYAASTIQERDTIGKAVAEMPLRELEAWSLYTEGKYPLPKVDWNASRYPAPTSTKPLRIARRRAEALNRLYKTEKAGPGHSVWFTENELVHLPLVKAMARVIGAERNLLGGQCTLNAIQIAELQSINKILSVSSQILGESERTAMSAAISSAQRVLGAQRNMLQDILRSNGRKRKGAPD
ncbi:hypothetical protein K469DRAFT_696005 [Zopfia rhizophila CBS 207.26]|uniref:Uncharacterized protein n=1 Tax=Zopfia rhizophila CBS 207.26 TaxID=1314779 RepID=A0A6A6EL83_9PEZI|nr:hypothetical protein K469DRAFT_696005 [Zopfia rhizophila CBS 207.26]